MAARTSNCSALKTTQTPTRQGRQSTSLVNGIYLADSLGHLMQTEFSSYLWWLFESHADTSGSFGPSLYGWRTYGDFGLALNINTRYPTFYAFKLMHDFVQPGDTLLHRRAAIPYSMCLPQREPTALSAVVHQQGSHEYAHAAAGARRFFTGSVATVRSYGMPQDDAAQTNAPLAMQDIATGPNTRAPHGVYVFLRSLFPDPVHLHTA